MLVSATQALHISQGDNNKLGFWSVPARSLQPTASTLLEKSLTAIIYRLPDRHKANDPLALQYFCQSLPKAMHLANNRNIQELPKMSKTMSFRSRSSPSVTLAINTAVKN